MKKFDTAVQYLKYKVYREVARHAFKDDLENSINDIIKEIVPGPKPSMRCCIYKERAILGERIKLATGGNKNIPSVIEVLEIACDECPEGGYTVTHSCRGCIAHRCASVCRRNAISFDEKQHAVIDKTKYVECGMCAKVCPYFAIVNSKRPCESACKVKAISTNEETRAAKIDYSKCIACGACVYQCPFGAISAKSYLLEVIKILKNKENKHIYAIVAPSIASQFSYAKLNQVITGLNLLGFDRVVEAALGADMVAYEEAKELRKKGILTSSCCPAFVTYIKKTFPNLSDKISDNLSPMATIAKFIKENDPLAINIFIGPCTAKKAEIREEKVAKYVDSCLTFEELQALFDAKEINLTELEESTLDDASYFGRIFARSGGLTDAVAQALKEQNALDFNFKPISCDGIEACKLALMKLSRNNLENNFIEGMACVGGCIGGPCALTHEVKNKNDVDKYGMEAKDKTITDSLNSLKKCLK